MHTFRVQSQQPCGELVDGVLLDGALRGALVGDGGGVVVRGGGGSSSGAGAPEADPSELP
ncbi:hypothetical protein GCM10020295_38440 [Streptomyces cinereospinus]